jgi:FkbM family methyltransferase
MGLWKFKWLKDQFFSKSIYRRNAEVLKNPLIFNATLVLKLFPGLYKRPIRFKLRTGGSFLIPDFLSAYIYWEIFLFKIYDLPEFKKEDITILDVGANIGLATLRFKMVYPQSEVYCFEPYKPHFELLNNNILNSKFNNIYPYQFGLAGDKRHSLFYLHAKNSGAHSIYPEDLTFQTIEIDLIDITEALSYTRSGYCDLLKLDCEGAEYEIILSIDKTISPRIGHIVYEATVDRYDPKELNEHLTSVGYRIEQVNGYIFKATYIGIE